MYGPCVPPHVPAPGVEGGAQWALVPPPSVALRLMPLEVAWVGVGHPALHAEVSLLVVHFFASI